MCIVGTFVYTRNSLLKTRAQSAATLILTVKCCHLSRALNEYVHMYLKASLLFKISLFMLYMKSRLSLIKINGH